jgi:hypothetical protein
LIQIATPEKAVLIDPFLAGDMAPLLELVFDPAIEKILHSGDQDMEIFYALGRRPPRNVFDTQVAAALAGHGESISYARLVEEILGVRLSKIETFTDWAKRPLTPQQIEYALADVKYLYPARRLLLEDLERRNRMDWLREKLQFYEETSHYDRDPAIAYPEGQGRRALEPAAAVSGLRRSGRRRRKARLAPWMVITMSRSWSWQANSGDPGFDLRRAQNPSALVRRAGRDPPRWPGVQPFAGRIPGTRGGARKLGTRPCRRSTGDRAQGVRREVQVAPAYLGSRKQLEQRGAPAGRGDLTTPSSISSAEGARRGCAPRLLDGQSSVVVARSQAVEWSSATLRPRRAGPSPVSLARDLLERG